MAGVSVKGKQWHPDGGFSYGRAHSEAQLQESTLGMEHSTASGGHLWEEWRVRASTNEVFVGYQRASDCTPWAEVNMIRLWSA